MDAVLVHVAEIRPNRMRGDGKVGVSDKHPIQSPIGFDTAIDGGSLRYLEFSNFGCRPNNRKRLSQCSDHLR